MIIDYEKTLQHKNPTLATEWHPTKNDDLKANEITTSSSKKVWWLGECTHEWEASIDSRTINNRGCPYCSGNKVLTCFNDLESQFSIIASEWHPTKNGNLLPSEITAKSGKKAWWLSNKCNHEWEARIADRTFKNSGCPYCFGNKILAGFNDLESQYPVLASEWHPTKNKKSPSEVSPGTHKNYWWLGNECNHEWEASPKFRIKDDSGCPYCANRKILPGFNDLESQYPVLASEWHPTKNGNLLPSQVLFGTAEKVWWLGKCGHEWETNVDVRTIR